MVWTLVCPRHGDIVAFVRQTIHGFAYYATPKQFAHYFKLMYDDTPSEYLKKKKG